MRVLFADTVYWGALLNPSDQWHQKVEALQQALGPARLVTTDAVLIEVLALLCDRGRHLRELAAGSPNAL